MGRYSTGATTVNGAHRIELSKLIKQGYFKYFGDNYGSHTQLMTWTDESSISIETVRAKDECYLRLYYTITNNHTGEQTKMDYKVQIEYKPSNLGKGNVLYFICPLSGKRCRILYRAYGSLHFKSREAFTHRLYYETQRSSKKYLLLDRFISMRDKVDKIWESKRRTYPTFKGKPTKFCLKFDAMQTKRYDLEMQSDDFIMANLYKK